MHAFITVLVFIGVFGAIALIARAREHSEPLDISPFLAEVIGGYGNERSYRGKPATAVTPKGLTVTVRCPHRHGHRSPQLAVSCVSRERSRVERYGR